MIATELGTRPNAEHREGRLLEALSGKQRIPSDAFLWSAAGSNRNGAGTSDEMGKGEAAHFVGQWAPTLLILGMYNKVVK